jgi:D-glycero-alpha-D-manno-heptose-7-phosphate kinase
VTVVRASAPVRICDTGGWTDTWFARTGAVFSIAVSPRVEVTVRPGDGVELDPLLEAAIAMVAPASVGRLAVDVRSGVPAGAGTGTSAAVVVALLAALRPDIPPLELARVAHRVETEGLGQESGVQDQLAAALGGINLFEVAYPEATVHPVAVAPATRSELDRRLVLVWLGQPHRSSAVHREVIASLREHEHPALDRLRRAARSSAAACAAGDLGALGDAMVANHEAQRSLHPGLVSPAADAVVEAARRAGAVGWKVNGAGGDGGSLTLLAGPDGAGALAGVGDVIPVELDARGVTVHGRADPLG